MWALLSRRLRMWLLFSIVIPAVRRLWGRAKANRMARRAQADAAANGTPTPVADSTPPRTPQSPTL